MESPLVVPTIDQRTRIPENVLVELARLIAEKFKPRKIILFGSYAYGTPRPESDVDLLVIMDTSLRETRQALEIRKYLNLHFGVDILVYTPARFAQRLEWGDSFLQEINENGRLMYESPDS